MGYCVCDFYFIWVGRIQVEPNFWLLSVSLSQRDTAIIFYEVIGFRVTLEAYGDNYWTSGMGNVGHLVEHDFRSPTCTTTIIIHQCLSLLLPFFLSFHFCPLRFTLSLLESICFHYFIQAFGKPIFTHFAKWDLEIINYLSLFLSCLTLYDTIHEKASITQYSNLSFLNI